MASNVVWFDGQHPVSYQVAGRVDPVVKQALRMFCDDMQLVTGMKPVASREAAIRIIQGKGSDDGFRLSVQKGQLVVEGHNARGTAYGLLELSRMAGVSPWVWWGDVRPYSRSTPISVADTFCIEHTPSVAYRGIFINDEDWSLRRWSKDKMGPQTYRRLFELMLRLRANTLWPAMHEGTPGFFTVPGNREMADSFGIVVGSSHCEPLLRNNVAEWNRDTRGSYNYITNRQQVQQYWIERLKAVKGSEKLFTIGMRGIHDGAMEGVKTKQEQLAGLQQVIDDQRQLIRKYYSKDVEHVPQVFIPYKEVLEIMESGLRVPDDVTLMWCDDNYGYLTRLPDAEQQKRRGGGGVYYHLSYWGRPHDYIWLTTTQPGLIYSEMKAAYDHNCRKLWIVNVHDPKVAAYDLEFFLDMAWNINAIQPQTINQHLEQWLCRQFGDDAGKKLFPAMKEFYRLCSIRKPEFMGWTQVELADRKAYPRGRSQVIDTEFTNEFGDELERYLADYQAVCQTVREAEKLIRPELKEAYFAAVKYPTMAANAMAVKMLEAQKARSMAAYREIQRLTDYYNNNLAGGKWKGIMNMMPRDLYVFYPPTLPYLGNGVVKTAEYVNRPINLQDAIACNAYDYDAASKDCQAIQMLGHSMNAVSIPKDGELTFEFETKSAGDAMLYTAMIPTQPNDRVSLDAKGEGSGDLRYQITLDDNSPVIISLRTPYRSEVWKQNVLRGQALRKTAVKVGAGKHVLKVKALDHHILFDQWMLDFQLNRNFYVIHP